VVVVVLVGTVVVVVVVDEDVVVVVEVDVAVVDDVDDEPVRTGSNVTGIVSVDAPGALGSPTSWLMTDSKPAQPAAPTGIAGITKL